MFTKPSVYPAPKIIGRGLPAILKADLSFRNIWLRKLYDGGVHTYIGAKLLLGRLASENERLLGYVRADFSGSSSLLRSSSIKPRKFGIFAGGVRIVSSSPRKLFEANFVLFHDSRLAEEDNGLTD